MNMIAQSAVFPRLLVSSAGVPPWLVRYSVVQVNKDDPAELRSLLERCASTSLNSKLIHHQKDMFSKMVVDAVMSLDPAILPLDMIGIKKVPGGALEVRTGSLELVLHYN